MDFETAIDSDQQSRVDTKLSPFTIVWQNLTHTVKQSRWSIKSGQDQKSLGDKAKASNRRILLDSICGHAKSGELTAILGPSGSGKSTLLKCLFQGKSTNTSGQILVEGKSSVDKLKVCFIPQNDTLNEWLTVREDLMFVSRLKRTTFDSMSSAEAKRMQLYGFDELTLPIDHNRNACQAAEMVGITNCLDVLIKDISGGEKKRLSLARELMSRPDVLVLDEPTTGLDSMTCQKIVRMFKKLVKNSTHPMAIVLTIHQPEKSVFAELDRTYFLAKTGCVIFDDNPKNALDVVNRIAHVEPPSKSYNPASFLLEICSQTQHEESRINLSDHQRIIFESEFPINRINKLLSSNQLGSFKYTQNGTSGYDQLQLIEFTQQDTCDTKAQIDLSKQEANSYFMSPQLTIQNQHYGFKQNLANIRILTRRCALSIWRDPTLTKARLTFHIIFPLLMVFVFQQAQGRASGCPIIQTEINPTIMRRDLDNNKLEAHIEDFRTTVDNQAYYLLLYYTLAVNAITLSASFYPLKIGMLYKEVQNGLYSPVAFHVAQSMAEFPLEFLLPVSSSVLAYYPSGQMRSPYEWRMLAIAAMMFVFNYSNHCIGLICGLLSPNNMGLAILIGQGILIFCANFSGPIIRPERLPESVRGPAWYTYLQRVHLSTLTARYGFNACNCTEDKIERKKTGLLTPGLRGVLDYIVVQDNTTDIDFPASQIFDKLTDMYNKAQTFGVDIKNCTQVKPEIMNYFSMEDSYLFSGYLYFAVLILCLQLCVFILLRRLPMKQT